MSFVYNNLASKKVVYVFSHERSGTHLALNLLYRNLYIQQHFLDLPVWKNSQFHHLENHWKESEKKVQFFQSSGGLIKSHCEAEIYKKYLPKFPVVYVVRDPRDTLVSFYYYLNNKEFHLNNPGLACLTCESFSEFLRRPLDSFLRFGFSINSGMENVVERWARHYSGWKKEPSCLVVRYEDLLQKMFWSVWRVGFFAKVLPKVFLRSYKVGENGAILPRKGVVGDWKNHFSASDLKFTKEVLSEFDISLSEWEN